MGLKVGLSMEITNTEVYGFETALRGMRNPMNSWHLQDTYICNKISCVECAYYTQGFCKSKGIDIVSTTIGINDMKLAKQLIKAGPEHCKFLRQIQVWADFNMPLYWWSEFDTYKFNTKNSCSTMHKLLNTKKGIELSDFVYDTDFEKSTIEEAIVYLNALRDRYLETKDFKYVIMAKRILPTSFKQLRTVNTNYAELINIYHQRKNHRLKEEWQDVFCRWVESLPYMDEFLNIGK